MPLGNLTSQFFANVYLNELDQFVKHKLKVKYYIRYVDDFVIFHNNKEELEEYKEKINGFLRNYLQIELHPDKSKIILLGSSLTFLGFRVFYHHRLLKKANIAKMQRKLESSKEEYHKGISDYDKIYDFLEGWNAYAKNANTYNIRREILANFDSEFGGCISTKEINR